MYENKKILILGAGKSGISVAKLLSSHQNDIILSDKLELDSKVKNELENLGVKIIITDNQVDLIDHSYDLIIKNPAIMYTSEIVKKCENLNLRVENEMEVAYHFLPKNVFVIGVTGSNGKTTTTTLIYEMLRRMNKSVVLGGNIGFALCEVIDQVKEGDILLLEISDHQLCDLHDFKTNISVLTNICPTHLDYHGTYEHYKNTKRKIFANHTSSDLAIINKDNIDAMDESKSANSSKQYFSSTDNKCNAYLHNDVIYIENEAIINTKDIKLPGKHNYENIMAALLVINYFGLDKDIVKDFLASFGGVEHRLEFVGNIDGVEYYNDSKSTNPTSTITALKTFQKPVHLILGGLNRNQDFNELNDYLKYVKSIYAIGETTEIVGNYAKEQNIECFLAHTLNEAMKKIKENVENGEVVLLSPGSSSQDQYKRFEDRGDEFKKLVEKL